MTLGREDHNQQHKAVKPGVVMLVGRWWVEHGLESDGEGLVGKCSKTQGRSSSRLDCTTKKRSNDDHGAAEMGRER